MGLKSKSCSPLDQAAQRYYAPLVAFFRKRTRSAPDAQDLAQQVFLRLSQSSELKAIENPTAYIFQTAANTLTDHRRRTAIRDRYTPGIAAEALPEAASELSPERVLQAHEDMDLVVATLRRLPERTRDILMLRTFEGLKHAEIARLIGISTRAVESHYAKALTELRAALRWDETHG